MPPRRCSPASARPSRRWAAGLPGLILLALGAEAAPVDVPTVPVATVEDGLQQVVDDALAANLELRAGAAAIRQRLAGLDQARARYLPALDIAARYSWADGGRTIEFPVGDLHNPVYATLDELLVASGRPPRFPRVENQTISFLRGNEQETKLVLEQPLYEPRLGPAVAASRAEVDRTTANVAALRSRVIRDTARPSIRHPFSYPSLSCFPDQISQGANAPVPRRSGAGVSGRAVDHAPTIQFWMRLHPSHGFRVLHSFVEFNAPSRVTCKAQDAHIVGKFRRLTRCDCSLYFCFYRPIHA